MKLSTGKDAVPRGAVVLGLTAATAVPATLGPGRSGQPTAHRAGLGTGMGEIHVRP